jgi:hypothetical protein
VGVEKIWGEGILWAGAGYPPVLPVRLNESDSFRRS